MQDGASMLNRRSFALPLFVIKPKRKVPVSMGVCCHVSLTYQGLLSARRNFSQRIESQSEMTVQPPARKMPRCYVSRFLGAGTCAMALTSHNESIHKRRPPRTHDVPATSVDDEMGAGTLAHVPLRQSTTRWGLWYVGLHVA